jgi:hypothetical protein
MTFTDSTGRVWRVVDYRTFDRTKQRLTVGDRTAEFRAFVPNDLEGPVPVYRFGRGADRTTRLNTLITQLEHAKSLMTLAGERLPPPDALDSR